MARMYTRASHICHHLSRLGVSGDARRDVLKLFRLAEPLFKTVTRHRKNFLQYDYTIRKLLPVTLRVHGELPPSKLSLEKTLEYDEIWEAMCKKEPRLRVRDAAARVIQRGLRRRLGRRIRAAIRIQRACHDWICKPVLRDGRPGIHMRILLKGMREEDIPQLVPSD